MHHRRHKIERSVSIPDGSSPDSAGSLDEIVEFRELGGTVESVGDKLPFLEVAAGVNGYPGESKEARGGAEEGIIPFRDQYAAWIGVETGEDGVIVC